MQDYPEVPHQRLCDVGEKELVRSILESLAVPSFLQNGRGNDATAVDLGLGTTLAVTVDRCPTPLAYKIDGANYGVWGNLAITCVASDLLASCAKPTAFVMGLLMPRDIPVSGLMELMRGADDLAGLLGAGIAAGDTKEASELNVITMGIGVPLSKRLVGRKGAKNGDVLVLTGSLGAFTAAHFCYKAGKESELDEELLRSVLKPMPAFKATRELVGLAEPVAGMDLSDGLLSTMFDLAVINGLGISLDEPSIPISARAADVARQSSIDPLRFAFGTGDWEIAFVLDQADWKRIQSSCPFIHAIGTFTADHSGVWLTRQNGEVRPLKRIEQEHFLNTSADRGFLEYLLEAPLF